MIKWVSWILIMALVLGAGFLVACGGGDDGGDEGGKTASPTKATGTVKPTATAGGKFTWDDIPIYPKASKMEKKASFSFGGGEERNYEKVEWRYYTTKDDPGDVHSFYLDKMPDKGWEKVMEMTMEQVTYSMWQKDGGNIGAWIGAGQGEKKGETVIWMWRGQGLRGAGEIEEEIEIEEIIEEEEPEGTMEPEATHPPVDPVPFRALMALLPEPPTGWVAEDPQGVTMTLGELVWSQASREYTRESTGEYVSVLLYDSAYSEGVPWLSTFRMGWKYETSEGYGKTITYRGYEGYEVYNKGSGYVRMILVADRYLVWVDAETKDTLDLFSGRVDYDALAELE